MGSVDRYGNLGIEFEWVKDFFTKVAKGENFWENNDLGTNKIKNMKSFLVDAEVVIPLKHTITDFGKAISNIGIDTETAWGLMLSNLVYSEEFNWWIMHTAPGDKYTPPQIVEMLKPYVASENSRSHIVSAYKNTFASNDVLGKRIGMGNCELKADSKKRILLSIRRESWTSPAPEVILYSLYKFAEACGDYYQFSLSTLMDNSIERNGVSPSRIFGLDRDTMIRLLNGLSGKYPDFISAAFTLDLETITLNQDKTSADVLSLF